jgi:hypothetical protein
MANTYTLIASNTVGSGGTATVTFSSIPATYTDLLLRISARANVNNYGIRVRFNSDTGTNYTWRRLEGNGASTSSNSNTTFGSPYNTFIYSSANNQSTQTASTFGNMDLYIPNYAGSNYKSTSHDGANENNGTDAYANLIAGLWSSSAAINSITLTGDGVVDFVQYSTFYLYGISNS